MATAPAAGDVRRAARRRVERRVCRLHAQLEGLRSGGVMLGTQHLWLFVVSGLLLSSTPGQDTLYIVTRSVAQGRAAGLWSVLGISTGAIVHTLAAAFGLSAILATSASAFTIVKLVGAAYLVYLGVRVLLEPPSAAAPAVDAPRQRESAWAIYRAAVLTNLLNPKVALFF